MGTHYIALQHAGGTSNSYAPQKKQTGTHSIYTSEVGGGRASLGLDTNTFTTKHQGVPFYKPALHETAGRIDKSPAECKVTLRMQAGPSRPPAKLQGATICYRLISYPPSQAAPHDGDALNAALPG